jgi:hypothetical protein
MIQIAVAPEVEVRAAIHRPQAAPILVRRSRRMTTKTKIRKNLENSSIIVFFNLTWSFKFLIRLKSF